MGANGDGSERDTEAERDPFAGLAYARRSHSTLSLQRPVEAVDLSQSALAARGRHPSRPGTAAS
jgi:hypothetical protein